MSCQNCVEITDKFLLWRQSQAFSFSLNKRMGDTSFLEPLSHEFGVAQVSLTSSPALPQQVLNEKHFSSSKPQAEPISPAPV